MSNEARDMETINKVIETKQIQDKKVLYEQHINMSMITKEFIQQKELILYGGLALNMALPKAKRFYSNYELPDYDFFSFDAKTHAKELADHYHQLGYNYVEVKPGVHNETYKVFVDFQGVADITGIPKKLFDHLKATSASERPQLLKNNPSLDIIIAPLSLLRLAFHIELSRPDGFIERWPKIYKRMMLFYSVYPLTFESCTDVFENDDNNRVHEVAAMVLDHCKIHGLPILGLAALKLYLKYHGTQISDDSILDKDMAVIETISTDYETTTKQIETILSAIMDKTEHIIVRAHSALNKSELIPEHYVISLKTKGVAKSRPIAIVYKSQACYSYKEVDDVKLLTIDSILSLTYATTFTARSYYNVDKIKCYINMLLNIQSRHINSTKHIWKRFDLQCYGYQPKIENVKREKWNQRMAFTVYRPGTEK